MAIYRLEAKIIGRRTKDKAGMPVQGKAVSVVAKAAYRSAEKLRDERAQATYNYVSRNSQVVHKEILAPEASPTWLKVGELSGPSEGRQCRERLWNEVERVEKRVDSQLAREFIAALPRELTKEQHVELVRHWCSDEFVSKGLVVDFAVHRSRDSRNPHAHILCTLRPVTPDGFGKKPNTQGKFYGRGHVGQGAKSDLKAWRASWKVAVNRALEVAGRKERVDDRSLKDRGIDRQPEPKIGVEATAMEHKGGPEPENVKSAREVRLQNDIQPYARDIQRRGEIRHMGMWWDRSRVAVRQMGRTFNDLMRDESGAGAKWLEQPKKRQPEKEATKVVTQPAGR